MLQEQRMGLSTNEALQNMLRGPTRRRCGRSSARSCKDARRLDGQIMRGLAVEMRRRRKAAAEQKAQKAPFTILVPLVFLIFPAMFVVLLGPALCSIMDAF